jgi:GTP diphosphokinase / guanosine-3',5'-bis(diphosphate) 3'-diphosphatase
MNKLSVRYEQKRFTPAQNERIIDAADFAVQAHDGQFRMSGEPYVTHPIAVAEIVAEWGLDSEAVQAALLHDVIEDTPATFEDVKARFGDKVAELVDGVTKLRLSSTPRPEVSSIRLAESNENLRKLLLASSRDFRVIMIKLADRLHNMRTIQHLPEEKRQVIARESLAIYGPLADRLGMGQLKGELEDLGFQYAMPDEFKQLSKLVRTTASKARGYLNKLQRSLTKYLEADGVTVLEVEGRQKHYYSIYKKLIKVDGDISKIYDFIAVRVIVPDVASCYQALGVLHQHYKPLIYRIKDYVAVPKTNGYQSLHTTVFADDGHITEIQIRTPEMHEAAEHGLAAHFYYDAQKTSIGYAKRTHNAVLPEGLKWVSQLNEIKQSTGTEQEFVEGVRMELFSDRIFVFTPRGDLFDLPEGSTPIDFAFAVHSNLGLRVQGAKVNGRMVTLDTKLENRDVVELITKREPSPSRDWLSFVATSHAKSRIRVWFKAASRDSNIQSGRTTMERELEAWGVKRLEDYPKAEVAELLDGLHLKSTDDLYAELGDGTIGVMSVIRRLIPDAAKPRGTATVKRAESTGRVLIEGERLHYTLAACCEPVFPQPLIGYITRGRGVTVHALGCRNVPNDTERYVKCRWETKEDEAERLLCTVEIRGANRLGIVSDITGVIARQKLFIDGIATFGDEKTGKSLRMEIEVPDLFMLASVIRKIERIPGVLDVRRVG